MDDSVSQAGYRGFSASGSPSYVSGITSTSATCAPRAFCVVCGAFSVNLTLRKSGLKCANCVGKRANKQWARLQKQQATQLLCQVNQDEQHPQQQPHQRQMLPASSAMTDSSSCSGAMVSSSHLSQGRVASAGAAVSVAIAHSGGGDGSLLLSAVDPEELDAFSDSVVLQQPSPASAATTHPIKDYISKTTVYKAGLHRVTHTVVGLTAAADTVSVSPPPNRSAAPVAAATSVAPVAPPPRRPPRPRSSHDGAVGNVPLSLPHTVLAATTMNPNANTVAVAAATVSEPNRGAPARYGGRSFTAPNELVVSVAEPLSHGTTTDAAGDGDRTGVHCAVVRPAFADPHRLAAAAVSGDGALVPSHHCLLVAGCVASGSTGHGGDRGGHKDAQGEAAIADLEEATYPPTQGVQDCIQSGLPDGVNGHDGSGDRLDGDAPVGATASPHSRVESGYTGAATHVHLREPSLLQGTTSSCNGVFDGGGCASSSDDHGGRARLSRGPSDRVSPASSAVVCRRRAAEVEYGRSAASSLMSSRETTTSARSCRERGAGVRRGRAGEEAGEGEGCGVGGVDGGARARGSDGGSSNSDTSESSSCRSGPAPQRTPAGVFRPARPAARALTVRVSVASAAAGVPGCTHLNRAGAPEECAPARAGTVHGRTDSSSSMGHPFGYTVKSCAVIGGDRGRGTGRERPAAISAGERPSVASPTAVAAARGGGCGGKFTVTHLTAAPRGAGAGGGRAPHARTDSSSSVDTYTARAAGTPGKRKKARPVHERLGSNVSTTSSSSSTRAAGCATSGNTAGTPGPVRGTVGLLSEGIEVKKIKFRLHICDSSTGEELHTVDRSYYADMVPVFDALKKAEQSVMNGARVDGGESGWAVGSLPPLPSRRIPSLRLATESFMEERRAAAEAFLAAAVASPRCLQHLGLMSLLRLEPLVAHQQHHQHQEGVAAAGVHNNGGGSNGNGNGVATPHSQPFLSNHVLNPLRACPMAEKSSMREGSVHSSRAFGRSASQMSGHSTRSSVARRSRLDCVTQEDLAAVQLGNLLGRGTFGSVYLGLIQSVRGPLMIAVKELLLHPAATGHSAVHALLTVASAETGTAVTDGGVGAESGSLVAQASSEAPAEATGSAFYGHPDASCGSLANRSSGKTLSPASNVGDGATVSQGQLQLRQESVVGIPEELRTLQSELDILRRTRHRNVVRFLGSIFNRTTNTLRVCTEYVECGTIQSLVSRFGAMPLLTIQAYMTQMLAGLAHLHGLGIVHGDIKGENVLVSKNGKVKLSDFGCSSAVGALEASSRTPLAVSACVDNTSGEAAARMRSAMPVGTPLWMAPEVITGDGATSGGTDGGDADPRAGSDGEGRGGDSRVRLAADVWALGCVGVEMLNRRLWSYDLERVSPFVIMFKIANAATPPHGLPMEAELEGYKVRGQQEEYECFGMYRDFLLKCFVLDPRERWTVAQLQRHPFLHTPFARKLRWMPPQADKGSP